MGLATGTGTRTATRNPEGLREARGVLQTGRDGGVADAGSESNQRSGWKGLAIQLRDSKRDSR